MAMMWGTAYDVGVPLPTLFSFSPRGCPCVSDCRPEGTLLPPQAASLSGSGVLQALRQIGCVPQAPKPQMPNLTMHC